MPHLIPYTAHMKLVALYTTGAASLASALFYIINAVALHVDTFEEVIPPFVEPVVNYTVNAFSAFDDITHALAAISPLYQMVTGNELIHTFITYAADVRLQLSNNFHLLVEAFTINFNYFGSAALFHYFMFCLTVCYVVWKVTQVPLTLVQRPERSRPSHPKYRETIYLLNLDKDASRAYLDNDAVVPRPAPPLQRSAAILHRLHTFWLQLQAFIWSNNKHYTFPAVSFDDPAADVLTAIGTSLHTVLRLTMQASGTRCSQLPLPRPTHFTMPSFRPPLRRSLTSNFGCSAETLPLPNLQLDGVTTHEFLLPL